MTENDCMHCPCLECQRTNNTSMPEKVYVRCKRNNDLRFVKNKKEPWILQENANGRWYKV